MKSYRTVPHRGQVRDELASAFSAFSHELADALFLSTKEPDCGAGILPDAFDALDQWGRGHFATAVELAGEVFRSCTPHQEELLAGWMPHLNVPAVRQEGDGPFSPGNVLRHALPRWRALIENRVSSAALDVMAEEVGRLIELFSRPARKALRILFIGDCLVAQVISCATVPCIEGGITIESEYLHNGIQPILRNEIRGLDPSRFDLVFFSPFSYTFVPEYGQVVSWKSAFWSSGKTVGLLEEVLQDVSRTLQLLAERFSCPVYVHNTAAVTQVFDFWIGIGKYILSLRNRALARQIVRQRVERWVAAPAFGGRVRLLDEARLRRNSNDFALGKVVYRGDLHHPSKLSFSLARGPYLGAMGSAAFLATKKVVVCDLDNTLWDGAIGEGPVRHFADRQAILKQLRERGVLLSINSKNDPNNVHFSGALLQMEDFVAPRINWQPKAANMAAILHEINIKEKDFVFIDDRPDELERVQDAHPAMVTLDARNASTWQWMAHWASQLPADQREDRTRLYQERAARENFLIAAHKENLAVEDENAALTRLQLTVRIESASATNLKRPIELINRTNQFNLSGSRVTKTELETGLGETQWVLTAAASDKFGSMGVVGVMVVRKDAEHLRIPVFVLSCRVFGFGIEFALLNAVRELAPLGFPLIGHYRETPGNQPCRGFYSKAGLRWDGAHWAGTTGNLTASPAWLTIETSLKFEAQVCA